MSVAWKSVSRNSNLITDHLRWKLGNGEKVDTQSKFWNYHVSGNPTGIKVDDIFDFRDHFWNFERLQVVCSNMDANLLRNSPGPISGVVDVLLWSNIAHGSYTTTARYQMLFYEFHLGLSNNSCSHCSWKNFGKTKVPCKILIFVWQPWYNVILTWSILRRHHLNFVVNCPLCEDDDDSIFQIFLRCSFAKVVWCGLGISLKTRSLKFLTFQD